MAVNGTDPIPLYPYNKYPTNILQIVHYVDFYLPIFASGIITILLLIYIYQICVIRTSKHEKNALLLHILAMFVLCILLTFGFGMITLSTNIWQHFPTYGRAKNDKCLCMQVTGLMLFCLVKNFVSLFVVFKMSLIEQNPSINYKYKLMDDSKKLITYYFWIVVKCIVIITILFSTYSAYNLANGYSFHSKPNNFNYCVNTFSLSSFLQIFCGDMLGHIMFGLTFGRPILPCFRDSKLQTYQNKIEYEYNNRNNIQEYSVQSSDVETRVTTVSLLVTIETNGQLEILRILKLIWITIACFWCNILLYVVLGLYLNAGSINIVVTSICYLLTYLLILINDKLFFQRIKNIIL